MAHGTFEWPFHHGATLDTVDFKTALVLRHFAQQKPFMGKRE